MTTRHSDAAHLSGVVRRVRTRPLRVCLVGAGELVSRGFASMLEEYPDRVELVGYDSWLPHQVAIAVVDASGVDGGNTAVRRMADIGVPVVLLLGGSNTNPAAMRARANGAHGYLSTNLGAPSLVAALEASHRGHPPYSPTEHHALDAPRGPSPQGRIEWTRREAQMIVLICAGLSNAEIATELYLSINSVKTYIRSAYRKLGLTRRSQVVAWGVRQGL